MVSNRGPNYTLIPNDWETLQYIINDLCNRIINEDTSFSDYLLADGSRALTADWDAGAHKITSANFVSDIGVGTAPFSATSTTVCPHLNASLLEGHEAAYFASAAGYVPYIGATTDVDLGDWNLTAAQITAFQISGFENENFDILSPGSGTMTFAAGIGSYRFRDDSGSFHGILDFTGLTTADKTFTFPDVSGTLAYSVSGTYAGIDNYLDQAVKTTSSPTFANITDAGLAAFGTTTNSLYEVNIAKTFSNLSSHHYGLCEAVTDSFTALNPLSNLGGINLQVNDAAVRQAGKGAQSSTNIYGIFGGAYRDAVASMQVGGGTSNLAGLQFGAFDNGAYASTGAVTHTIWHTGSAVEVGGTPVLNNASATFNVLNRALNAKIASTLTNTASSVINVSNYGLYIDIADTCPAAAITTNYGVYNYRITGADTNYFLYDANSVQSVHSGNIRIGGTTNPTYACDVTGEINASTGYRINGTAGASGTIDLTKTATVVNGIITQIS